MFLRIQQRCKWRRVAARPVTWFLLVAFCSEIDIGLTFIVEPNKTHSISICSSSCIVMKLPLNFPVLCDPAALGSCGRKYQFIITKGYTLCLAVWSYLEKARGPVKTCVLTSYVLEMQQAFTRSFSMILRCLVTNCYSLLPQSILFFMTCVNGTLITKQGLRARTNLVYSNKVKIKTVGYAIGNGSYAKWDSKMDCQLSMWRFSSQFFIEELSPSLGLLELRVNARGYSS